MSALPPTQTGPWWRARGFRLTLAAALALLLLHSLPPRAARAQNTAPPRAPLVFSSPEQEQRFKSLAEELRCAVCQNQSLADSDAPLAQDLRQEIFMMLEAGASDEDIKRFLVDRYGDFVLYRPPVRGNTLLLWLGPGLLLVLGAAVIGYNIRRRRDLLTEEESGERLA
jgi:cytochrome c-type biogenesis protein CcmH